MDLAATLEKLTALVEAKTKALADVKSFDAPWDKSLVVLNRAGTLEFHAKARPSRAETFDTLADICAAAVEGTNRTLSNLVLWVADDAVRLVYDDASANDMGRFELRTTTLWNALVAMSGGKLFTLEELRQLLRITLGDQTPHELLRAVRSVKFSRVEDTAATLTYTDHSLGKSVELTCSGSDLLPEEFTIKAFPFLGLPSQESFAVRLALDVVHAKQSFRLQPIGEILADAIEQTLGGIVESIESLLDVLCDRDDDDDRGEERRARILVYRGNPNLKM